ncbi:MAG: hypothetical protein ACYC0C_07375 [Devosia sp.]
MALTSNVGTRWLSYAATRYRCASEFRGRLDDQHGGLGAAGNRGGQFIVAGGEGDARQPDAAAQGERRGFSGFRAALSIPSDK